MALEIENIQHGLSLEEARELLQDETISDEQILIIIEDLKVLCSVAAYLYRNEIKKNAA